VGAVFERGMGMSKNTIYVFAPDLSRPLGGMRMLYRHVDILNANGFSAFIVHASANFKINWFEHQTPVLRGPVKLKSDNIAVYSEIGGLKIAQWAPGNRKAVLNQNAYYSFMGYPLLEEAKTPYMHPEVVAAIVVSEDSKRYLEYVFPKLAIHRIKYSIDPKLYYITGRKKKQICFMPRKNVEDARQVLNILRYRKALDGWKVVAIEKKSQAEAAEILRDSLIFMSFGHPEGFGLPPAEAMAAGCITIGYHGNVREFFTAEHGFPIEMGQILHYARTVEEVIKRFSSDIGELRKIVKNAAAFVREEYSGQRERESIVSCWEKVLNK
jgi:glycosyltransferase involved in cell wall biosynthesis